MRKLLSKNYIAKYLGRLALQNHLPFRYSEAQKLLEFTGSKDDIEDAILDLHDVVVSENPKVAKQLPPLEELCKEYAGYLDAVDKYRADLVDKKELKTDGLTLTEKGFDSLETIIDMGAVSGIGFYIPVRDSSRKKFLERIGISTKKPGKLGAILGAGVLLGAAVLGAAVVKDMHSAGKDIQKEAKSSKSPQTIAGTDAPYCEASDPANDVIYGRSGESDHATSAHGEVDIRNLTIKASGQTLRVELTTREDISGTVSATTANAGWNYMVNMGGATAVYACEGPVDCEGFASAPAHTAVSIFYPDSSIDHDNITLVKNKIIIDLDRAKLINNSYEAKTLYYKLYASDDIVNYFDCLPGKVSAFNITAPPNQNFLIVLADTHIGATYIRLHQIAENITLNFREVPKYVLVLGDIANFGYSTDGAANYQRFLDLIKPLEDKGIKVCTIPGNHDYMAKNDVLGCQPYVGGLESLFGTRLQSYKNILGDRDISGKIINESGYVIIGLDSGHDRIQDLLAIDWDPEGSGLTDNQIKWLDDVLDGIDGVKNGKDTSGKAIIIASHHPWLAGILQSGTIAHNADRALALAKKYGVDVVLAGHKHKNNYESKDGTRHYTTASVAYEGTWRNITISNGQVIVAPPKTIGKMISARTGSPVELQAYLGDICVEPQAYSSFAVDNNGSMLTEISVDYNPGLEFRVAGTAYAKGNSTYNFEIQLNTESENVSGIYGKKIPTDKGLAHQYHADWDGLASSGVARVNVQIDYNGDGRFDESFQYEGNEIPAGRFSRTPANNAAYYLAAVAVMVSATGAAGYLVRRQRKLKKLKKKKSIKKS